MATRSLLSALLTVALALPVLGACELEETPEKATESPQASASAKPSAEPTSTAKSAITVVCYDPDSESEIKFTIDRERPDWTKIWATKVPFDKELGSQLCSDQDEEKGPILKPVSPAEQTIWDKARRREGGYGSQCEPECQRDRFTLANTYVQCVEHDSPYLRDEYPGGPAQADEARIMLTLCPDHPQAAAIRKRAKIQDGFNEQIENGETIGSNGTWRIGQDYPPGTYQTKTAGSALTCYWARKAANGDAIASGGADPEGDVHTITVTIRASDHSFYTENCGVWFRIK